ncbi:MAG: AMP-binding protein [Mycobacterium sp.]
MTSTALPGLIALHAKRNPDRVFLEHVDGGAMTYRQVHDQALCWAEGFERIGVRAAELVGLMMPAGLDAFCAWLGLAWLRAIPVPINTLLRGRTLEHVLVDSTIKVAVVATEHVEQISDVAAATALTDLLCPDPLPYTVSNLRVHQRGQIVPDSPTNVSRTAPTMRDVATVLYTSGTTGAAKGVLMPWGQLHATAEYPFPLDDSSSYYTPFPLYHISGLGPFFSMAQAGGRVVLRNGYSTSAFWSDVTAFRCTEAVVFSAIIHFLLRQPASPGDADNPLRHVIMVPPVEAVAFCERFGVQATTMYNMTELSCPLVHEPSEPLFPGLCGKPRAGYELRLVDDDDYEVPRGAAGELVVRTEEPWRLSAGYLGRSADTVTAWRNLWFHTGDMFTRDDDDRFVFVDRKKDAIRRRGENISSAEVEAEVLAHPAVRECAAIPVPSPYGEDEVMIVVSVSSTTLAADELAAFCESRMPRYMVPRYIDIVDELPRTATGKVRKAALRDRGITKTTWARITSAQKA